MPPLSRRVRRASLSETPLTPSAAPSTPSRRSRRLSGVEPGLEVAPDGGVIQRNSTPRRDLVGTPNARARRHTSVKSSDVQEALNLAPVTPALPILVEEEEEILVEEEEEEMMEAEPASTPTRRGSKRKSREEAVIDVEMEEELVLLPKSKKKAKTLEEEAPKKMSRWFFQSLSLMPYCFSDSGGNRKYLWGRNWQFQRTMRFRLLMKLLDLLSPR